MHRSRYVPLALLVAGTVLVSCDQARVADPLEEPDRVRVEPRELLAICELVPAVEYSTRVGLLGGTLSGGGVVVNIPPGAVLGPTDFHVSVPSSPYAEVEIRANGQDHYQFLLPIVIGIEYDRCGTPEGALSVWHIDPDTKTLLENMGGVKDVLNMRISFSTMHLSGYAIAN